MRVHSLFRSIPVVLCVAGAAVTVAATAAQRAGSAAEAYPNKPIRFIVPYAAGGGVDFITRLVGQKLTEAWGQQVVVDNRPGAAGIIATEIVAKALPDGYTLLLASGSHATNPSLRRKLPYDPVKDFAPVALVARAPVVLSAHPAVPAGTAKELVALAKTKPGQLAYASFGVGSTSHLAAELFKLSTGVDVLHVPYKGAGDAMANLLAGQVQFMFSNAASVVPQFKAGKLKALAVTGAKRPKAASYIPTFEESGLPGVNVSEWFGVLVPAGTPPAIIARLNAEIVRIARSPEVGERLANAQFAEAVGSTPGQLGELINSEIARWGKVIRQAGVRVE